MTVIELQAIAVLRALTKAAGCFLLARGALYLLAGVTRERNTVYQLLVIVTRPLIAATRFVLPRFVRDSCVPLIAFCLLFCLWIFLAYVRLRICGTGGSLCA